MPVLIKHAKRGKDKTLPVARFYTSAHGSNPRTNWNASAHIRFTDENDDLLYSARFTIEEAKQIAKHFAQYVEHYGVENG